MGRMGVGGVDTLKRGAILGLTGKVMSVLLGYKIDILGVCNSGLDCRLGNIMKRIFRKISLAWLLPPLGNYKFCVSHRFR